MTEAGVSAGFSQIELENISIRRTDLDDSEPIRELIDIDREESINRVFNYAKVLHLIETSYLSITALDAEGNIIAYTAFEDHPQGMKGLTDPKHENLWEKWLNEAFDADEFDACNTLWLTYFVYNPQAGFQPKDLLKKIFQTVYTSISSLVGMLFLVRGEVEEGDTDIVFAPIQDHFSELECVNREALKSVRGIHYNSRVFFSKRVKMFPFVEIRTATQEDHDDLATIFNTQSEVLTEQHGDYFIAELIAAQSDTTKALVAQVKSKAVGLLALTTEIDVKLLQQCFDLDTYDNLLKGEFMDAVRQKREEIILERQLKAEELQRQKLKRLKEETLICNRIAHRMQLQQYMLDREVDIINQIDGFISNKDQNETLEGPESVYSLFKDWLKDFKLNQPSEFFLENPTDDPELVCSIMNETEIFLETLETFGLPAGYMNKVGHWVDWGKKQEQERSAANRRRGQMARRFQTGRGGGRRAKKGQEERKEEELKPPTYFDMAPLLKAMKRFLAPKPDTRSLLRREIEKHSDKVKALFVDDNEEVSEAEQVLNMEVLGKKINSLGGSLPADLVDTLSPLMICFAEIPFDQVVEMVTPDPNEETKQAEGSTNASGKPVAVGRKSSVVASEPQKPVEVKKLFISYGDLINSLEKLRDYDQTLTALGVIKSTEESKEEAKERSESKATSIVIAESKDHQSDISRATSSRQDQLMESFKEKELEIVDTNREYDDALQDLEDLDIIPSAPEKAHNAFCVTLFCLEEAFESRAQDFLQQAFDLFPNRDYMIITQPHVVPESSLIHTFTPVKKRPHNTFNHVLYVIHRDALMTKDIYVRRAEEEDVELFAALCSELDDQDEVIKNFTSGIDDEESKYLSFSVKVQGYLIGGFVITKNVNLEYYRSHFHIEDFIILKEHDRDCHSRLVHAIINPIFFKSMRTVLKEIMRLANKTCLYFETYEGTIIPDVYQELIHVRSRRFPHFLKRKWDHERYITASNEGNQLQDGFDRDPMDEDESHFSLSFLTKKLISEPKIVNNSRIVVVGASDTGISFIETLLSTRYLHFTNITLLAPGGLNYRNCRDGKSNLKSVSTSYTNEELARLMLEAKVRVIDARMVDIDRQQKNIFLHDDSIIAYDTLVLTIGLQDEVLQRMGYSSRGIAPVPEKKEHVEGLISIDDPFLYQHFREDGTLLNLLTNRKKKGHLVIFGSNLHSFCCIQGLLERGVPAHRITLMIPEESQFEHEDTDYLDIEDDEDREFEKYLANQPAFEYDDIVQDKIEKILEEKGIEVLKNVVLEEIKPDNNNCLDHIIVSQDGQEAARYDCRILITSGPVNIDEDVFKSIHNNGLVYNGRLVVDKNFQTTDPAIFAGGKLCEFSRKYFSDNKSRAMRLDRYSGREVGWRLALSVLDFQDPVIANLDSSVASDEIPAFYKPQGKGGVLPGGLLYHHIRACRKPKPKSIKVEGFNRADIVCDNFKGNEGHYIRFTFNNHGLIESVSYLGTEEVVVNSLWGFVGLSETYLNQLTSRYEAGVIPNVVEFLSENWAIALYHDWFSDFCYKVKTSIQERPDIQAIMEKVFEKAATGSGVTREDFDHLKVLLDDSTKKTIKEETMEYIRANMNHLPMYYIPKEEFP